MARLTALAGLLAATWLGLSTAMPVQEIQVESLTLSSSSSGDGTARRLVGSGVDIIVLYDYLNRPHYDDFEVGVSGVDGTQCDYQYIAVAVMNDASVSGFNEPMVLDEMVATVRGGPHADGTPSIVYAPGVSLYGATPLGCGIHNSDGIKCQPDFSNRIGYTTSLPATTMDYENVTADLTTTDWVVQPNTVYFVVIHHAKTANGLRQSSEIRLVQDSMTSMSYTTKELTNQLNCYSVGEQSIAGSGWGLLQSDVNYGVAMRLAIHVPTPSPTSTPSNTPSPTRTPSSTMTLTATPTGTGTGTATGTPTGTGTRTPSSTGSSSPTPTASSTSTRTASPSGTGTPSRSASASTTSTQTRSATATPTRTLPPSPTPTPCPPLPVHTENDLVQHAIPYTMTVGVSLANLKPRLGCIVYIARQELADTLGVTFNQISFLSSEAVIGADNNDASSLTFLVLVSTLDSREGGILTSAINYLYANPEHLYVVFPLTWAAVEGLGGWSGTTGNSLSFTAYPASRKSGSTEEWVVALVVTAAISLVVLVAGFVWYKRQRTATTTWETRELTVGENGATAETVVRV